MTASKKSSLQKGIGLFGLSRMLRSKAASPGTSSNDLLAQLTGLSQKIAAHAIRFQIGEVVTQARATLNYLQAHPTHAVEWQNYVRDCLVSTLDATRHFAALSSHLTDPTDPTVTQFHEFLMSLSHTLSNLHAKLTAGQPASFTSGLDAYRSTLHHINQAYSDSSKI